MMTLGPNPSEPTLATLLFPAPSCWRLSCRYELLFRQSVGAEDVFLGMGGKSPATASCPYQVVSSYLRQPSVKCGLAFTSFQVRISLPATQLHEVELRVTDTFLDCSTPS